MRLLSWGASDHIWLKRINENKGTPDVPTAVSFFCHLRPTFRLAILAFLILLCACMTVKPAIQEYKGII